MVVLGTILRPVSTLTSRNSILDGKNTLVPSQYDSRDSPSHSVMGSLHERTPSNYVESLQQVFKRDQIRRLDRALFFSKKGSTTRAVLLYKRRRAEATV